MNLAALRAELEADRAWREEEIRVFQNRGSVIEDAEELNRYRRALVLLLYAHYEDFVSLHLRYMQQQLIGQGFPVGKPRTQSLPHP